ncbi:MAG: twin-arginine translocation pathway signal protein [Pseudomonadota bacterium]
MNSSKGTARSNAPTRRLVLKTGACAAIITLGAGCDALDPSIDEAIAPWDAAGQDLGDPRLNALAFAILAPNPHNRQPWLIELVNDDEIVIRPDLNRLLPETDPLNRQIVVGFGCFLELLRQSAAERGYATRTDPFPEGEPQPVLDDRPIARVILSKQADVEADSLFKFALQRRTVRTPFFDQKVDDVALVELERVLRPTDGAFGWATDSLNVTTLKELCYRGWRIEANNKATHEESARLTRIGKQEVMASPDGISLYGRNIELLRMAGILTEKNVKELGSTAHNETIKFYNGLIETASAFGWLSTPGNTRTDQLNAGTGWLRLHLAATRAGLAMHPLSQVLQEFPAMSGPYEEIHDYVGGGKSSTVQGLFRFGYAEAPTPSPRWPLKTRIVSN